MIDPVNLRLALISAAMLGFRHGLDYDHIAAITDISSVQSKARDSMKYGLLYVAGHATTVAILGAAAVVFRIALPPATDRWAERLVGITLLVLGLYVLGTFFQSGNTLAWSPHTYHITDERSVVDLLEAEPDFWRNAGRSSAGLQRRLRNKFQLCGRSNSRSGR